MGTILSYIAAGWPFAIPNLLYLLKCHRPDLLKWLQKQLLHLPDVGRRRYTRYRSVREEAQYWQTAKRFGKVLDKSNARSTSPQVPLVRYYEPRLLPIYRKVVAKDPEAEELQLSLRTFCKWHRMVFPDKPLLSVREARERIKHYSTRDRQEIRRIARLLSDEVVFEGRMERTIRYKDMWKQWLREKGPDVAIVFLR